MRSIQLVAPRTLEERPLPQPPDPGPGEALVRIRAVGICGSDLHWYLEGGIGSHRTVYPQVLGHEPTGEVAAIGAGVDHLKPGDRVTIEPSITCGQCEPCRRGDYNICRNSIFVGTPDMPGAFREYMVIPARNVLLIPNRLSFAQGALIEPLAVIVHIFEKVRVGLGDTVAVIGAGSIGTLCVAMARVCGASIVFAGDRVPHRLDLARKMGATHSVNTLSESYRDAVMDQTNGRGVDVAIDAAAKSDSLNTAIQLARHGGKAVLVGIASEPWLPVDVHDAMARELDIQTIRRSNHNDQAAIDLLASGRVSDALITHRLPLERTPFGFEALTAYSGGVGKVVIELSS